MMSKRKPSTCRMGLLKLFFGSTARERGSRCKLLLTVPSVQLLAKKNLVKSQLSARQAHPGGTSISGLCLPVGMSHFAKERLGQAPAPYESLMAMDLQFQIRSHCSTALQPGRRTPRESCKNVTPVMALTHLVIAGPVGDIVDKEPLTHGMLRGCVVAAGGHADVTILHAAVVVAGNHFVQHAQVALLACKGMPAAADQVDSNKFWHSCFYRTQVAALHYMSYPAKTGKDL